MIQNYKIEGIIIKRMNVGEADRLVTLLTKDHGKVRVIAKGVRKITSRRASALELFNHTACTLHRSKKLSDFVIETTIIHAFDGLGKNLQHISNAYQLCEMVNMLTREGQDEREIYELLWVSLERLSS